MKDSSAIFSPCGLYRYVLTRRLHPDPARKWALCIGLNPPTASDKKNDATITRLSVGLAELGYGGFYMCNLYGIISSKPDVLRGIRIRGGKIRRMWRWRHCRARM